MLGRGVAHVPQERSLFPAMSVWDNVLMGGYLIKDAQLLRARLDQAVSAFPICRPVNASRRAPCPAGAEQVEDSGPWSWISVVEPKLKLTLDFPKERYHRADRHVHDRHREPRHRRRRATSRWWPPCRSAAASSTSTTNGARYDPSTRTLRWPAIQLEPGAKEKVSYPFHVRMGGPAATRSAPRSAADGGLGDRKWWATPTSSAWPTSTSTIEESRRVVDVNDTTTFTIRIKNVGTKEATRLLLSARHSDNIEVIQTAGTDAKAKYSPDKPGEFVFPLIERLGQGAVA